MQQNVEVNSEQVRGEEERKATSLFHSISSPSLIELAINHCCNKAVKGSCKHVAEQN